MLPSTNLIQGLQPTFLRPTCNKNKKIRRNVMNSRGRPRCTLTDLNGTVYHGMFVVFDGGSTIFCVYSANGTVPGTNMSLCLISPMSL